MTLFVKSVKRLLDNFFELPDFFIVEGLELSLPPPLREHPAILPDEHEEVLGKPVRHFDRVHDTAHRLVMLAQVVDLARQVGFDRTLNACIQQLHRLGAIEVPIEVGRIVQHLHVAVWRWTPLNEWHQRP